MTINARYVQLNRGSFTIETAYILLGKGCVIQHQGLETRAYVMIAVSDTGTGMPPAVVERAIEPFSKTKKSALGAALVLV